MTELEIRNILVQLRKVRVDLTHVEAKAAETELPKRLWETISAFSNTRGGGTIILGISEEANFAITGVRHASKIQQGFANICSSMEPAVRPHIEIHEIEGKHIVTAQIAELPIALKPCYHPSAGLTNGAFIRVADGDRKLSHYEVQMLLSARGQPKEDEEPVPGTGLNDLQPRLLTGLLGRLRARSGTPFKKLSNDRVLRIIKVLVPLGNTHVCSLGALLALGKYPQQTLPGLGLTSVVYPAVEVGEPGLNQERFLDNARIEGPIPLMLEPAMRVLRRNMKQRSIVRGLYREDVDEYPLTAIREALINAVAHRDLSSASRGTPVQLQMFPNRLSIINPGGLFGPVTLDLLGREGISSTRNSTLLRLLEDINPIGEKRAICENRGSGVGAMFAALREAGLPEPDFDDRISSFRVTFLNTPTRPSDSQNIRPRRDRRDEILALLASRGELSRGQISEELGLGDAGTRKWLTTLRDEGKVEITTQQTRSKNARYRTVSSRRPRPRKLK
ncbi:MAG: putative DNA binding domain-containing protein [Acidobacteriaceae bacterium]|nr:putative DNA binding domain-containing protein [Acidobacteriaceae bacterium]